MGRLWAQQLSPVMYNGDSYIHNTEMSWEKLRKVSHIDIFHQYEYLIHFIIVNIS